MRLALICVWLLGLFAAPAAETIVAKGSSTGKHSAWVLQGANSTVTLLGSVHVLKKEHYPLPDVFESAFSNANVVVFETEIAGMNESAAQQKMMARAILPEGTSIKDHLSEETYSALKKRLEQSRLPEAVISRMKPGFAMVTLVVLEIQRLGYRADMGMDQYFYTRAKQQGKDIRWLESVDFQIGLICDLTDEEGDSVVKSTLDDLSEAKTKFEALLKAWQTGDEANLEELLNETNRQEPGLMKKLITDRNASWVSKIESYARGTNDTAVIVGAAHLVGEQSVLDMLRQRGWEVTQQ
jgi:hypothetical protein